MKRTPRAIKSQTCSTCQDRKPLSEFYSDRSRVSGYQSSCKSCQNLRMRVRQISMRGGLIESPEKLVAERKRRGGRCDICGCKCSRNSELSFDHDHRTGKFRGFICNPCNLGLGNFKDDIDVMKRAIKYLENFESPYSAKEFE